LTPLTEAIIRNLSLASAGHGDLYVILDAAREKKLHPRLCNLTLGARCLYEGPIPQPVAETAPYLVPVHPRHAFTEMLVDEGWGQAWGIFLSSSTPPAELRRHLRRFLTVMDEQGKQLYFRYYDPRVFRVYLPTCNEAELKFVFGPVERFWCESEDGRAVLEFAREGAELKQRPLPLPA
jgi:hypothetical protein